MLVQLGVTGAAGRHRSNWTSLDPFDLELLDAALPFLDADEDGDVEGLAAGAERAQGVFHVRPAGNVADVEGARSVILEERLHYLLGLALAGIAQGGDDGYLKVVGKPCGETVGIALGQVFGDGHEHVSISLGLEGKARRKGQDAGRYFEKSFHIEGFFIANIAPRCYICGYTRTE